MLTLKVSLSGPQASQTAYAGQGNYDLPAPYENMCIKDPKPAQEKVIGYKLKYGKLVHMEREPIVENHFTAINDGKPLKSRRNRRKM